MKPNHRRNRSEALPHPSLKGINYVLFPYEPKIQLWDNMFLVILIYYCFSVPYTIGVSGGYRMYNSTGWLVVNALLNFIYIVDTFMQFFRAYHDKHGILIYDLKKIAWNYFTTWFIINIIASFPTELIYAINRKRQYPGETIDNIDDYYDVHLFGVLNVLKLFRILRVKGLAKSSDVTRTWWERQAVAKIMVLAGFGALVVFSHWLACFWSFLAFLQAGTFGTNLGVEPNWIANWYNDSPQVGINPIGWSGGRDLDRYALSLFWSIQSITSIGYGNIVPVTRLEYYFANIFMLISGAFWASVIGHLVSIMQHLNSHTNRYKVRMEEANDMIQKFSPPSLAKSRVIEANEANLGAELRAEQLTSRVRSFLTSQYEGSKRWTHSSGSTLTLEETFPALGYLSFELRRASCLRIMQQRVETVPYLSSRYLTPIEQSDLIFKGMFLEFARGETFHSHPSFGRGVLFLWSGYCLVGERSAHFRFCSVEEPLNANGVLVEDDVLYGHHQVYKFITYTRVFFIPRCAIVDVLSYNKKAWKDCGRWKYLEACLIKWARERRSSII